MIEAYFVTWFWKNLIWMCWMGQIIYFGINHMDFEKLKGKL